MPLFLSPSNIGTGATLGWSDAMFVRESANTISLRNSTNAQTLNVFGTADAGLANYRRLRATMTTGGAVTIAAEGLGTGATGNTLVFTVNGVTALSFGSTGVPAASFGGPVSIPNTSGYSWSGRNYISAPADAAYLFQNAATTDVDIFLKLGINTSAGPGIKRVGTVLQARLNDDSAFATIQGKIRTDTAYVAGVVTDTGTITITDSTGTAYRVLCAV